MAALNEEQNLIRDQARAWVEKRAPVKRFRALRDSAEDACIDTELWSDMVEMGWTGILVPEEYGGTDLGQLTFGLILEELGRQLVATPLLASALIGVSALRLGGSERQKTELLPKIVDGSVILTLAVDEDARHAPSNIGLKATKTASGFRLEGTKVFVLEGNVATDFIIAARTSGRTGEPHGITLFHVPGDVDGLTRERLVTMDHRGYANLQLEPVEIPVENVIGKVDEGYEILSEVMHRARAGLAVEMFGTASEAFEVTLEYLKTRVQFGRVIGSFQALGHRASELFTELQLVRSCVEAAGQAIDAERDDVSQLSSLAKCRAGELLQLASNEMIQIHGGIGMTDECDVGLYLKRARVVESTFGNQAFHREAYARHLGI